ncbi:MAG: M56 family metallopeptidase [Paraglaciecola sp.]|uniref:M56 family metallopeptidase n=1 Tax=Paraglaciecola sp. TaxID=1920173 RepID=UPI003296B5EA
MTTYLTITLLISSICGLTILLLGGAPARLRFYICLLLMVSWLTPWQLLQFQAESNALTLPLNILTELTWDTPTVATQNVLTAAPIKEQPSATWLTFDWLWQAAFVIGLLLFSKDLLSFVKLHRRWIQHSTLDNQTWKTAQITQPNCDIRRIDSQSPGMATGLINPIIWLDSKQHDAEKIRTIVLHELTHIRQHDPYWLWAINLLQRLFWWNPLVWFTAHYARQQIELSCDEQCKKHLPEGRYQLQLIKLTLQANKPQHPLQMPAVLQMSGTPAFNLQRINKLNKEHNMKKRHAIVMASLLSLTGWIGFSNATVNSQQVVFQEDKAQSIVNVLHTINDKNFTEAQSQLAKLTTQIDNFETPQQAKILKLQAHVLYELEPENPQILAFMDSAIALEDEIPSDELLDLINMAQALAASQQRWDKQLSYADHWFNVAAEAGDNSNQKNLLYMTAVSHYSLAQYNQAISRLNDLMSLSETQGEQPQESWLKLLMANHVEKDDLAKATKVQAKITMLYPTQNNQRLLNELSYNL